MTKTTFADPADDEPRKEHRTYTRTGVTGTSWAVQSTHINIGSEVTMPLTDNSFSLAPEFPDGGDPRFRALLSEILALHIKKGADYGSGADWFANCRGSEALGIDAWKGVLIRMGDKMIRLHNAAKGVELQNESVQDSMMDLANYSLIALVLFNEEVEKLEAAAQRRIHEERVERGFGLSTASAPPHLHVHTVNTNER